MRNPYEVFGLDKNATDEEIQSKYRSLAREFHPDMHRDKKDKEEAESKFKEITAAYEVIGSSEKRAHFDRFGEQPQGRNPFSGHGKPFGSPMDDFFSNFFRQGPSRQQKGQNIVVNHNITLEEAFSGGEVEIKYSKECLCSTCHGLGGDTSVCNACNGNGVRIVQNGPMQMRVQCDVCGGNGRTISKRCTECNNGFMEPKEETVSFSIPKGVESGMRFAFRGQGNPCPEGVAGDVFVVVHVANHDLFERLNNGNLLFKLSLSYSQLVLGDSVEVPTLEGMVDLKIPSGTQLENKFRLKNKGMPMFREGRVIDFRGDQLVQVKLDIPKDITEKHRQLIEELAKLEKIGD